MQSLPKHLPLLYDIANTADDDKHVKLEMSNMGYLVCRHMVPVSSNLGQHRKDGS